MTTTRREFLAGAGALTVSFALPSAATATSPPSANGAAAIGDRLRIESSGIVRLFMGKVELGQGIGTALAQIVADELDVSFSRILVVPVTTDYSPDESYTFSSISVQQSGPPTRRAAAAARQHLLNAATTKLGVQAAEISVQDGRIYLSDAPTSLDYWQLLENTYLKMELPSDVAVKQPEHYSVVGKSIQRVDIPRKVYGQESFIQDLRLPGMLHARVVRPAAERATIARWNVETAEQMPGVVKVVRDGNFVAVVADREEQARRAAQTLRKDIKWKLPKDLPDPAHLYDWLKAARSRLEPVFNEMLDPSAEAATRTIRASYQRPYQAHASISPSAAIATFERGKLTVLSHAQGMYPLRLAIAHVLGLAIEDVRCIHYESSGCFGHNGADDAACDAAVIAMQLPDRPIRLQWERADEFAWEPYGSAMHMEASAALDRSGKIRKWGFDIWSCPHTSRPRSVEDAGGLIYAQQRKNPQDLPPARSIPQPNGGADRNAIPLYAFDNTNVTKHLVTDMPMRVSALRGLGAYGNVFAIESFMDELSASVGEDPLSFRLKHLDDERGIDVLEKLAKVTDWYDRPTDGDEGWGLGFAQFKNRSSYVGIVVRLVVDSDTQSVRLRKATAVCDAGLVINPDGASAQIEGGIVQSASWTLKEQVRFNTLEKQSLDWTSYPILRFDEVPEVEVIFVDRDDRPSLGTGEAAQGPTAAAIANAIFDNTGQRLRRLPLTLRPTA